MRCLGQYLGLASTRPENEYGTGPDVLWLDENGVALCMEIKSDKLDKDSAVYRKEDIGQMHSHIQWVKDNQDVNRIVPIFVGPSLAVSPKASPSSDMIVVELWNFEQLGTRLAAALEDVTGGAAPSNLESVLFEALKQRNLMFADVLANLDAKILQDIASD